MHSKNIFSIKSGKVLFNVCVCVRAHVCVGVRACVCVCLKLAINVASVS